MNNFTEEILGQKHALESLLKISQSGNIPHALLFSGPEGTGKHLTAIKFAQLLNSNLSSKDISSQINKLQEPYVKYILPLPRGNGETNEHSATEKLSPDSLEQLTTQLKLKSENPYHKIEIEKANNIKINSIRDVKKFISFNFEDARYRFIIISDAHKMSKEAQNSLLKSLEEPPEGIIFILITPYKNRLLQTIESRCWHVIFNPLPENEIKNILTKYFNKSEFEAKKVSNFCNGSVTEAVELINKDFEFLLKETIKILRFSLGGRYNTAIVTMNNLTKDKSKDTYRYVLYLLANWFNDVNKNRYNLSQDYPESYLETLSKFNEKFDSLDLVPIITKLNEFGNSMDKNVNLNLISLNIILELALIAKR